MIVCWNSPILCFNNKQFLNEVKGKFPDKKGNNHFELSTLATDNKIINRNQCSRQKSSFLGENVFCGFCWCFAHRFIWEGDFLHYLYSLSPELWKSADGFDIVSTFVSHNIYFLYDANILQYGAFYKPISCSIKSDDKVLPPLMKQAPRTRSCVLFFI